MTAVRSGVGGGEFLSFAAMTVSKFCMMAALAMGGLSSGLVGAQVAETNAVSIVPPAPILEGFTADPDLAKEIIEPSDGLSVGRSQDILLARVQPVCDLVKVRGEWREIGPLPDRDGWRRPDVRRQGRPTDEFGNAETSLSCPVPDAVELPDRQTETAEGLAAIQLINGRTGHSGHHENRGR